MIVVYTGFTLAGLLPLPSPTALLTSVRTLKGQIETLIWTGPSLGLPAFVRLCWCSCCCLGKSDKRRLFSQTTHSGPMCPSFPSVVASSDSSLSLSGCRFDKANSLILTGRRVKLDRYSKSISESEKQRLCISTLPPPSLQSSITLSPHHSPGHGQRRCLLIVCLGISAACSEKNKAVVTRCMFDPQD